MILNGIKANFLGDSITEGCGTTDKKSKVFHALIAARNNMTARDYGIGGTRFAKQHVPTEGKPNHDRDFCQRVEQMEKDADLLVIFGGTNDFGHGDAPFGEDSDRTPDTFIGACHHLFSRAIELYPDAKIVIMTPLHRETENVPNRHGRKLYEYVEVIRKVAEYYSLPVIDLWKISGIQPAVRVIKEKYCPDGLHPNDAGHEKLAAIIEAQLSAL